jgi:hypothetical protein
MIYGNQAIIESGIPLKHGRVFSAVAKSQKCIVISRSVGKYATGLIQESYATKGFHVKAKSCNWGPMAGMVLADSRFSKNGPDPAKASDQQKLITKAIHSGAGKQGVYISQVRRFELFQLFAGDSSTAYSERQISKDEIMVTTIKANYTMFFILKKQSTGVPGTAEPMWALCYRYRNQLPQASALGPKVSTSFGDLYQLMALTDPLGDPKTKSTYRAALTGDYDLWGCFPEEANFRPDGLDQRRVKESANKLVAMPKFLKDEDEHLGNITRRVEVVRNHLNSGFKSAGYTGGNIVHHSDEAGRPMVDNIEVDAVAFFPGGDILFFDSVPEYKNFISIARASGYKTILNAWWKLFKEADEQRMTNILGNRDNHMKLMGELSVKRKRQG